MNVVLTFANQPFTEFHHLARRQPRSVDGKVITFPMSTGQVFMRTGAGHRRPLTLTFAEEGMYLNRLIETSIPEIETKRDAIQALYEAGTRGTLIYNGGKQLVRSIQGVRLIDFEILGAVEPWIRENVTNYMLPVTFVFQEFTQ